MKLKGPNQSLRYSTNSFQDLHLPGLSVRLSSPPCQKPSLRRLNTLGQKQHFLDNHNMTV